MNINDLIYELYGVFDMRPWGGASWGAPYATKQELLKHLTNWEDDIVLVAREVLDE